MLLTSVATFKSLMGGPGPLARASLAAVGSDAPSLTPPTCSTVVTKREVGRRLRRNLPRWSVGGIVRRPSSPRASSPHMAPNADDTGRPRGTRTRTLTLKGGLGAWVSPGSGVCGGCAQDRLGFLSSCARFGLQGAAQTSGFDGFGTFCDRLLGYFGRESISRRAPDTLGRALGWIGPPGAGRWALFPPRPTSFEHLFLPGSLVSAPLPTGDLGLFRTSGHLWRGHWALVSAVLPRAVLLTC